MVGKGIHGRMRLAFRCCWYCQQISLCNIILGPRIQVSNHLGTQTIASRPSQFTWYIPKMILDGWEGDPWALSLASGWFLGCCCRCQQIAACEISLLGQNPGVQSPWHPNHCFWTIPIHLIHPQNDFGWLGRGSMGSKSCMRLVSWLLLVVNKSACEISFWVQNPGVQSPYGTQTIASEPSQFTWYILKMILDGWEGDPWALSLASGWFGCCWLSTNQLLWKWNIIVGPQNPGVQSAPWQKYHHCWARIQVSNHLMASKPLLLNHPNSLDTS
jgi:hypothetical protein